MNRNLGNSLYKRGTLLIAVAVTMGLGACTSTDLVAVSEPAPVTYKIGENSTSYEAPPMAEAPKQNRGTGSSLALPRAETPRIDLSGIDRGLYNHMKLGNPYKVAGQTYFPKHNPDYDKVGIASWYGDKFHGKPTANGEIYDKNALTAAHKTLPLNSFVYVTSLESGKTIKVRLNDRGPFIDGRIIDLSEAAAHALGITQKGLGQVRVQYAGAAKATDKGPIYRAPGNQRIAEQGTSPLIQAEPEVPPAQSSSSLAENNYRPLREGGSANTYAARPDQNTYIVPNIMNNGRDNNVAIDLPSSPSANAYDMPPIPEPLPRNEEDGVVTLTIRGPIHMAKTDTVSEEKLEIIPATYEGEK